SRKAQGAARSRLDSGVLRGTLSPRPFIAPSMPYLLAGILAEREEMDRAHTPAWRNFKRMQDCACLVACLIYAGAVVHAGRVLPGPAQKKLVFTLAPPLIFLALTILLPMVMGGLRRLLRR